ncbi:MAG: hypothetical protein LIO71_03160 [Ruminococcus sp.]|nr:hypothetical protein [Ruminococcus sp.]
MKIDFNKWWNNSINERNKKEKKIRYFIDKQIKVAMNHGYTKFAIKYEKYYDESIYIHDYLEGLGLIVKRNIPYPYCYMDVAIPEREE